MSIPKVNGFNTPFRLDRNSNGRDIMLFVRWDVPAKLITSETPSVQGLYIEVRLRKQRWFIRCSYNPNESIISQHVDALGKSMDLYSSTYENFILLNDFNARIGSELNQKSVSDSAYSIKSVGFKVAIFRNFILTLNVRL